MKLAVIDLRLHYPPAGGAGVDLFASFSRLRDTLDIRMFCPAWQGRFPRGNSLYHPPLPVEPIPVESVTREGIVTALRVAVDSWKPDGVFIADGWTLKPYLVNAFTDRYPTILRLYAYEMLCPRNNERWLQDRVCNNTLLLNPQQCLACAAQYRDAVKQHRGPDGNPLTHEAECARIWDGFYPDTVHAALRNTAAVIVYNRWLADHLKTHLAIVPVVLPGGVDPDAFTPATDAQRPENTPWRIFVPGRMDDPAKGADIAVRAGKHLAAMGLSFHMTITRRPGLPHDPWIEETGWLPQATLAERMRACDVVFVPSIWEEAFGMTWVEAMAAGLPVVASAVAGPRDYIRNEETGLLFPPGDTMAAAECLKRIMTDAPLRQRIAKAGREMVLGKLTWDHAAVRLRAVIHHALHRAT